MNFERNNSRDLYETLRIGERAAALEFKTIHIIVVHTYMERNLDGINRKKESQTIILLQKHQMEHIMAKLQEGILTKELIMSVLARGDVPGNPIFVSPPIFYTNEGVKWPSASVLNHGDPDVPHYLKDLVEKWIIVNGGFWKLPQILADKYPKHKKGYGWEV